MQSVAVALLSLDDISAKVSCSIIPGSGKSRENRQSERARSSREVKSAPENVVDGENNRKRCAFPARKIATAIPGSCYALLSRGVRDSKARLFAPAFSKRRFASNDGREHAGGNDIGWNITRGNNLVAFLRAANAASRSSSRFIPARISYFLSHIQRGLSQTSGNGEAQFNPLGTDPLFVQDDNLIFFITSYIFMYLALPSD